MDDRMDLVYRVLDELGLADLDLDLGRFMEKVPGGMSRDDADPPITLAQLIRAEVVDESGRRLGHVHDVRVVRDGDPAEPDQAPPYRVEGLVVGPRGIAARLGLSSARSAEPLHARDAVPWEQVVGLEPDRVIVRQPPPRMT